MHLQYILIIQKNQPSFLRVVTLNIRTGCPHFVFFTYTS